MKVIISLLFLMNCLIASGQEDLNPARAIMVLYVAPVKVEINRSNSYSKSLSNTIRSELVKSKKYKLANPEDEESIELAKNYNESCLSVEECARKEAKALEADLVLITEVDEVESQCKLSMRLENIYSKEIMKSKSAKVSCDINDLEEKATYLVYLVMRDEAVKSNGTRDAYFTTNPSGAKVTIDGKYLGTTPLETKVKTGQIKILLEIGNNKSFAPILVSEVVEESTNRFNYHKSFALKNSYLHIEVTPPSAQIKIDGKVVDNENNRFPVDSHEDHVVEVSYEKFKTQTIEIDSLVEDETKDLDIKLQPLPCEVSISSSPNGGTLFKSEKQIGETPFKGEFTPGDYKFVAKKERYETQDLSFYCAPDERVQRVINFKRAKYTEEEQERIDRAKSWRIASYVGFTVSAGLGYLAYKSFSDFKKYDSDYSSTKDPFAMEDLKKKRDESKSAATMYTAGAAISLSVSYLFYKIGEFPEDLLYKDSISFIPQKSGGGIAWHHSW